ncbi:MAG TPA: hypothetical protein VLJ14_09865 [Ktedonobacterales bacterium]|jgi:hypothetical protein|nr:hypothetical protein [Ktedonobacterales bacterium]
MQLSFDLGDPRQPRGHAIVYARTGGVGGGIVATYVVVLPIQFSIGKYLPPILSGQVPLEGLADPAAMSVVPIPPMLEDIPALSALRQLAERRGDDLCDLGTIFLSDDGQRMAYAAEACQAYGQVYGEFRQRWPAVEVEEERGATPLDDLNVEDVMAEVLPERDRLGELARLIGQARYAVDGNDARLLGDVTASMGRITKTLPEKYRADQLVRAAVRPDAAGARLAELYLQRAYKLLEEDYAAIPPIEREIQAARESLGGE